MRFSCQTSARTARPRNVVARMPAVRAATLFCFAVYALGATIVLIAMSRAAVAQSSETEAPAADAAPVESASQQEAESAPKTPGKLAVPSGPDLTPYAVLVRLNVPLNAEIDARFRDQFVKEFTASIRSAMGQMWTTVVEPGSDPRVNSSAALSGATAAELTEEFVDSPYDKVFLAGASRSGSCWSIIAREWDAASQTLGAVEDASTCDGRLAATLAGDLVMRLFRPVARIESVDGTRVVTTVRAGEFPPADAEYAPFSSGDQLTPFVRYYDRDRNLLQIRELPWTFLQVDSVTRARMECETVSAYRTPLAGSRRRMELMAIEARPTFGSTRLIVAPRGDATDPLPGCRVEVLNRIPTAEDPVEDRLQLLTDRRGSIVITADPGHPLQHVLVHSGKALLARVPLIPGLEETMTLAIPDDAARLSVEGSLSVLEGELIDAVARRAMLMARARRASKGRDWDDVDIFIEDLQDVPDYEAFRQRVASVQLPAVQSARELGDRVAESRIKKMCADLQQAASGHLDAEVVREFRIEMDELRRATQ